jgi:hypothetical protein
MEKILKQAALELFEQEQEAKKLLDGAALLRVEGARLMLIRVAGLGGFEPTEKSDGQGKAAGAGNQSGRKTKAKKAKRGG